jgi:Ran GTPase-activating protein (RanGAP) involved in mRNA processing and transport
LETNKTLTDLWLPANKITDRGLKRLAEVLKNKNKTLKVLSLEWNKFSSDSTVDILLGMLHNNTTLTSLNLNSCKLSRSAITQLKNAAKSKKNFELAIH